MELSHLDDVHLSFYLAVNKQITDKTHNIFPLTAEYSVLIKHAFNMLNSIM